MVGWKLTVPPPLRPHQQVVLYEREREKVTFVKTHFLKSIVAHCSAGKELQSPTFLARFPAEINFTRRWCGKMKFRFMTWRGLFSLSLPRSPFLPLPPPPPPLVADAISSSFFHSCRNVGGLVDQPPVIRSLALLPPSLPPIFFLVALTLPMSSEYGTHQTVKARFWPWLSD